MLILTLAAAGACTSSAQDSGALIDALIRKGILTHQEGEDIRAELVRENNTVPAHAMASGKSTHRLSVGMRMQIQHAYFDTEIRGPVVQSAAISHAALRRVYLTLKAGVGADWGASMTYDLAAGGYDEATIEWRPTPDLSFDFGLRKVNVIHEERSSSGNIRAIERSSVTRYFVETNNGRRLGAASYRIGAFMDGRKVLSPRLNFLYSAAVTDPERNESFTNSALFGDGSNNKPALWATLGLGGTFADIGGWTTGIATGHLPNQGGSTLAQLGRGWDLGVYSVFLDVNAPRWSLLAEYMQAQVERGVSATTDAQPEGLYVQPGLMVTDTFEAVIRYAWINSDGRGLTLSDVIRSAASGGTMNRSTEWFAGANWYLRGNDLKLQIGAVHGKTFDTVTGAPGEAKATGIRSQMQVQF